MKKKLAYVVGFNGDDQVIYGKHHFGSEVRAGRCDLRDYASPMTCKQAIKARDIVDRDNEGRHSVRIYKLVDVTDDLHD